MNRPWRPVPVSAAAAGDAITCAAVPDPDYTPNAAFNWLAGQLETLTRPGRPVPADTLNDLLVRARQHPAGHEVPPYLVIAATRAGTPVVVPLGTARAMLASPEVTCYWRPHPRIDDHELLLMRPAANLGAPEHAGLFFPCTAPPSVQAGWAGEPW